MELFYYMTAYFLIYSFLGWALEVAYHVVSIGKVINRGFLNGPVCPIYGVGMIVILIALQPFTDNLILLYLGGILFATAIELFGGFILYKAFHMRWWDYSNEPFNLGGFICLKFSLAWGVCILFAVDMIHPIIELNVYILDGLIGHVAVIILYVLFLLDIVITVLTILNLNKNLNRLNSLGKELRRYSDGLTEKIGDTTIKADAKVQGARLQVALAKADLRDDVSSIQTEMEQIRRRLASGNIFGYGRLYKAFPTLKHDYYNRELRSVAKKYANKVQNLRKKI